MNDDSDLSIALKSLIFQMHMAGVAQSAIASYVGKSKTDINRVLKPLRKGKENG
jgi:hypothetical protein